MARYGTKEKEWNYRDCPGPYGYGSDTAYEKGMALLDHNGWLVEDWGCGATYAKKFLTRAKYRGIDFTPGFADRLADLVSYHSDVEGVFMRGVLEHNPRWRQILQNALDSFTEAFVLITFIPLEATDRIIDKDWPTLALDGADFHMMPAPYDVERTDLVTVSEFGKETIWHITHKKAAA